MPRALPLAAASLSGALLALAALAAPAAAQSTTLELVRERGSLVCGVSQGLPGFSAPDEAGGWSGLDVDLCRAVAAAVLGDPDKVEYIPLSPKERFTALQSGEIDLLCRVTTWTLGRDTSLALDFAGVNYYDGQGFLVPRSLGLAGALELDGASVCLATGTTTELNLADYFRANGMEYEPVLFEKNEEALHAYTSGRCDALTSDRSGLAAQRSRLPDPENHVILPETISKEPLGPVVRHGDNAWGDIVRWTFFALLEAEELGVTQANAAAMRDSSASPAVRKLLGAEGQFGEAMGLDDAWALRAVQAGGNYGESYERHVGPATPLGLARGLNALWRDGGLQYPMPVR